tara:strand:- start:220 stop:561 length:342 start_codon:yes stop_codon:yes gene_type:complete
MKIIKLLTLSLLISTNCFGQESENIKNQVYNIEKNSITELENLKSLLDLNAEQVQQVSSILEGIKQKNGQVSSMNLIQDDKDAIIERNQQAKSAMILAILNETQKAIYLGSLN